MNIYECIEITYEAIEFLDDKTFGGSITLKIDIKSLLIPLIENFSSEYFTNLALITTTAIC